MKNIRLKTFFLLAGIGFLLSTATIMPQTGNKLNWVEISQTKLSTRIMFDFTGPVQCNPELINETQNLNLTFPGMSLQNFDATLVQSQLSSLQEPGILKNIAISEKNKSDQTVNLALEFCQTRAITNPKTNTSQTVQNRFLIKWSVLENPHRFIIDIFFKEDLEKLVKKDAVLLYAANDIQQYDTAIPEQISPTSPWRIIIDPGHGGSNTGTTGHHNLLEKDITLDISRRVHSMLAKRGYRSFLIRNSDKDISLLERIQLAHQLQGDLFISIHANSAGRMDSDTSGLETFYLNGENLLAENKKTGFSFINLDHNQVMINNVNTHLKTTLNQSKILAECIQNTIIDTLAQKNIIINNRGVKQEKFRVLLQTGGASIPASLVEVGFLTNRKEAGNLAKSAYRTIIAQGIFNGICSYLDGL